MRYSFLLIIFQAVICFGCTRSSTSGDANVPVRVSVEYWEKEPLVTPAQMVSSKALLVQSCDER